MIREKRDDDVLKRVNILPTELAMAVLFSSHAAHLNPCGTQVPMAMAAEVLLGKATWFGRVWSATLMLSGGVSIILGFLAVSFGEPAKPDAADARTYRDVDC